MAPLEPRDLRFTSSSSRMPLKMGALLLCLVGLALVAILVDAQQISQTTVVRRANQERRTTAQALKAFVVPSKASLTETGFVSTEREARAMTETHEAAVEASRSSLEETNSESPPQTISPAPTPALTSMDVEDPATLPPQEVTASPVEHTPEPPELTAPLSETVTISSTETTPAPPSETPAPTSATPAPSPTNSTKQVANTTVPVVNLLDHPEKYDASVDGSLSTDFECAGWRRTGDASPDGPREPELDQTCATPITGCISGYCVFRHKQSGELKRALLLHSNSLSCHLSVTCDSAPALLNYGQASVAYVYDPNFQFDKNRDDVRTLFLSDLPTREAPADSPTNTIQELSFHRGITMVVHGKVLGSAYVSIRLLRSLGCTLPIEVWYRRVEVQPDHPILKELESKYGVFVREILDPNATKFYTKLYAVFYSAFDHVMLLDADNFAVKDPSYLFETPEYQATGAMFWPDFWRPAATIFHIIEEDLLWQVLGIQFVDMFEQESGQLLIDRKKHQSAINVLMYYGFTLPRLVETMEFAWGDKDLFRFAWMKTNSSFHYIATPPGSAGLYDPQMMKFCGLTMVQHDPQGEIVFLHRNSEKMVAGNGNKLVWTHIEQLKHDAPIDKYQLHYDPESFANHQNCWGLDDSMRDFFTMTPMTQFPFQYMETELLKYGQDAGWLVAEPPKNEQNHVLETEPMAKERDHSTHEPSATPLSSYDGSIPSPVQRTLLRHSQ